jgi:hypothetical protein
METKDSLCHAVDLKQVEHSDYRSLARFAVSFANETRNEDFWLHRFHTWWEANPAFQESIPRGWVLRENGTIKGFLGNIPSMVRLFGRQTVALNITTWRVLSQYRNHSLRLLYRAVRCIDNSVLFDATPSQDAARVLQSLGFRLLRPLEQSRRSVLVVNPTRVLASRLRVRHGSTVLAQVTGPILKAIQTLRLGIPHSRFTSVRLLTTATEAFDDLWRRTQNIYANTNVRTAAVVNWQCFQSDYSRKLLLGCFDGDRLLGYLIGATRTQNELKLLRCLDFWAEPGQHRILGDLLAFLICWAPREGFDLVEIPHFNDPLASQLASLGLLHRGAREEQPIYYKIAGSGSLNSSDSYFGDLQGDRNI